MTNEPQNTGGTRPSPLSGTDIHPADIWLIIPVFNEAAMIGEVLDTIRPYGYRVVVVDDCSTDRTYEVAKQYSWIDLIRHPFNLGQGAALRTGLMYASGAGARYSVTMDGDGQHRVEHVQTLIEALVENRVQVALGSRFLSPTREELDQIPIIKRIVLRLAIWYTRLTTRIKVTDVHHGFRAMTGEAARTLDIRQNRMAHASEILTKIARRKITYVEAPVPVVYSEYSLNKGQGIWNSFNILWETFFGGIRR